MKQNIETFIGCDCEYEKAEIVLFGAPFDSTTSYRPGARFGSSAMRHESFGLETYSPYQDKDLTDCFVFDSGDLELCFGNTEDALSDIEQHADQIMEEGKNAIAFGRRTSCNAGKCTCSIQAFSWKCTSSILTRIPI